MDDRGRGRLEAVSVLRAAIRPCGRKGKLLIYWRLSMHIFQGLPRDRKKKWPPMTADNKRRTNGAFCETKKS